MSANRKKRKWLWIVTLLIGLPALYIASFGPASWASLRTGTGGRLVGTIYHPIFWLALEKNIARGPILWYMGAGKPSGSRAVLDWSDGKFAILRDPP